MKVGHFFCDKKISIVFAIFSNLRKCDSELRITSKAFSSPPRTKKGAKNSNSSVNICYLMRNMEPNVLHSHCPKYVKFK